MNSLEYKEKLNTFIESMSRYLPKEKRDIAMIYFEMGALWGRRALAEKNGVVDREKLSEKTVKGYFLTVAFNNLATHVIGRGGLPISFGAIPKYLLDSEQEAIDILNGFDDFYKKEMQRAELYCVNQDNERQLIRLFFKRE
jgi:hypothetical protein